MEVAAAKMMAKGNFDGRVGRMVDVLVDERLKDEWVTSGDIVWRGFFYRGNKKSEIMTRLTG